MRSKTGNRPVLAVVKADAYGHGAIQVSKTLLAEGAYGLAVAYLEEAVELREAGIKAPIVVLFGVDSSEVGAILEFGLTPVVWSTELAAQISREAVSRSTPTPVHVKVDTGMGRVGIQCDSALENISKIALMPGLDVEGIFSHFSDADLADPEVANEQLERFNQVCAGIAEKGIPIRFRHIANSAAVIRFPESVLDMARPGLMLYGYHPAPELSPMGLKPAMSVDVRIVDLKRVAPGTPVSYARTWRAERESLIATVSIGYADGYSRSFSNNGHMLVRGGIAPVVGRVCMDLTMLDVTEIPDTSVGDRVTVMGQSGARSLWADALADRAGTIPYEILTSVGNGKRLRRAYA